MSVKNVQARLDLIHKLTIGDGTTTGDRRVLRGLRKILNKAETQIILDTKVHGTTFGGCGQLTDEFGF